MNVLIGTDGSDHAIDAATHALALLGSVDVVTLLCVVEPPAIATAGFESGFAGGGAAPTEVDAAWDETRREATVVLERTAAALTTAARVDSVIASGDAGTEICRLAAELPADVVVVGSRGRGAIRRALLGSVSTQVVNRAPCSVLVTRAGADGDAG